MYDEFSACLLLVMSCVNVFNLTPVDLGIEASANDFLRRLLREGATSTAQGSLSPERDRLLSLWIKALFETEGISDDIMSACPPQEFYTLVPTLVRQSMHARKVGVLGQEKMGNGLERTQHPVAFIA